MSSPAAPVTPYKIAVLVYLFDDRGRVLLLHRKKAPNRDLYSPIGGKLEQSIGESPYACALREMEEEVGIRLGLDDIRLVGLVSERGYVSPGHPHSDAIHWLMFCFEVVRPVDVELREFEEGRLEWIHPDQLADLNIPRTDREVIWPLMRAHSTMMDGNANGDTFSVHIDCTSPDGFVVTVEHPRRKEAAARSQNPD